MNYNQEMKELTKEEALNLDGGLSWKVWGAIIAFSYGLGKSLKDRIESEKRKK